MVTFSKNFRFRPQSPSLWLGRFTPYSPRHAGNLLCLGREAGALPLLAWRRGGAEDRLPAEAGLSARALSDAVLAGRRLLAGGAHGHGEAYFSINEFGQVLVVDEGAPGRAALCGEVEDLPRFVDGDGSRLDLSRDPGLEPGEAWGLPLLGCPFYLSRRTRLYFQHADGRQEQPGVQDWELVESLRGLHPSGPLRLLVTPAGFVLAPAPDGADLPPQSGAGAGMVFAGRIRQEHWFEKEDGAG